MANVFFYEDMLAVLTRKDGSNLAQIHLDRLGQVQRIILMPHATKEEQESAVRLAAYHAKNYLVARKRLTGHKAAPARFAVPTGQRKGRVDFQACRGYMLLEDAHRSTEQFSYDELCLGLTEVGIAVATAHFATVTNAITHARDAVIQQMPRLELYAMPLNYLSDPRRASALFRCTSRSFVVKMQKEKTSLLINKKSDELQGTPETVYVRPPREGNTSAQHFCRVRAKDKVEGPVIVVEMLPHFLLTQEGADLLGSVVAAALGLNARSLAIS